MIIGEAHRGIPDEVGWIRPVGDPRGPGRGPTLARGGRSANAAATAMAATPAKAKAMGGKASAGGGSGLYSADQVLY